MTSRGDDLHNYPLTADPVPAGTPPLRIALVGCGKTKLGHPAPARDLYVGNLFRAARAYVEAAGYGAWFVLSARYGLVHPTQVRGPYEATMDAKTVDSLAAWVNKVDGQLRATWGFGEWSTAGGRLTVDILAGAAYADPLVSRWSGLSWTVNTPLAGLQMGERLGWLKDRRAARGASDDVCVGTLSVIE